MNTLLFLAHISILSVGTLLMLRMGKSALMSWLCVQSLLANLFVLKQISLFGLTATASDAYIISGIISLNLLQEYYGKKVAQSTIWINSAILMLYIILAYLHIRYVPAPEDSYHEHYASLLAWMPRIILASFTTYLIVQCLDTWWYGLFKKMAHGRYLILRNIVSITLSQALDTLLFSFFGLYGILSNLGQIMLVSFTIKMITMLLMAPGVIALSKKLSGPRES